MKKLKLPVCLIIFLASLACGIFIVLTMMAFIAVPFFGAAAVFLVFTVIKLVQWGKETSAKRREKRQREKEERANADEKPKKKIAPLKILLPAVAAVLVVAIVIVSLTQCGGAKGNGIKYVQVKDLSGKVQTYYSRYLYEVEFIPTGYEPWDEFFEKYDFRYAISETLMEDGTEFKLLSSVFKNTEQFPSCTRSVAPRVEYRVVKMVEAYNVEVEDDGTVTYYSRFTPQDVVSGNDGYLYQTKGDAGKALTKHTIQVARDNIKIIFEQE